MAPTFLYPSPSSIGATHLSWLTPKNWGVSLRQATQECDSLSICPIGTSPGLRNWILRIFPFSFRFPGLFHATRDLCSFVHFMGLPLEFTHAMP